MSSLPKTYKAWQFASKGGELKQVTKDLKEPQAGEILAKVVACGVCHSDMFPQVDAYGAGFDIVPGHEIVADIVAVPSSEKNWKVGQRIGSGWHGGHDGSCKNCQRGVFVSCDNERINGIKSDGGYAEYVTLRTEAIVEVSKDADPLNVGPLFCAGVTVFNAIRNVQGLNAGDYVAIQGIGGLGHLGIQYANAMGYNVVALSTSESKKELATKLGAKHYIVGDADSQAEQLAKMGGVKCILVTAPNPKAVAPLINGLGTDGTLMIVGAQMEPIPFNTIAMIGKRLSIRAWASGASIDWSDCIAFAEQTGVKTMYQEYAFADADKAFNAMMSGEPRFRAVLKM